MTDESILYIYKFSKVYILIVAFIQDEQKCIVLFRENKLTVQDFKVLATINKIDLNQFEMDKLL